MLPNPTARDVASSPAWLPHRYDPGHDAVHFVHADRATRTAAPFLTDEHLPGAVAPVVLRRDDSLAIAAGQAPIHFIFHSAYCCSTLLANAFDRPGMATSFKEPVILNDLIGWRHRGGSPARVAEVLDSSLTLLSRPFAAGEASIVKPSNLINVFAPAILACRPEARGLLLYAPLKVFLGSIAAKGLWGRLWVRDLMSKQLKDGLIDLGLDPQNHFMLTDLQVAAVGWLAQQQLFASLAAKWPHRTRMIDSETLLEHPHEALAAMAALYDLPATADSDAAVVSTLFQRHAKFGGTFSRSERVADQESAARVHADEIEKVTVWAEAVAAKARVPLTEVNPLLS
jgi:hypothetical protein